jgi:Cu+-exporting ATPase
VLIRSAEALETLEKVDTVVVDKTGTLTEGKPRVTSVVPIGLEKNDLLRITASLERASEHPLAAAVLAEAAAKNLALAEVRDFQSLVGRGAEGIVEGQRVAAGSRRLMDELEVKIPDVPESYVGAGEAEIYVAIDRRFAGCRKCRGQIGHRRIRGRSAPGAEVGSGQTPAGTGPGGGDGG